MATPDAQKKILTAKDLKPEGSTTDKRHLNFYDMDITLMSTLKSIWASPLGKVAILGIGSIGLIYLSGYGMELGAWWLTKYHRFKNAANPSSQPQGQAPPKA